MRQVTAVTTIQNLDPNNDASTWSFEFESAEATGFANIAAVITACQNFVNTAGTGGTHPVCYYLGRSVDLGTNHASVEVYDITGHLGVGARHGPPVAMQNFTVGSEAATPGACPEGVAACLSFRGDYGTDVEFGGVPVGTTRPRSRDRNRVFIGPISSFSLAQDATTQRTTLYNGLITDFLAAIFDLSSTHTGGTDHWNFRVWSKMDAALKLPTEAWMDNRPDYQRRRSDQGGVRTFRPLASV
jgi:hypothetical protein